MKGERATLTDFDTKTDTLFSGSVTKWLDIFQYLPIYNNEHFPSRLLKLAKGGSKFCLILNKPSKKLPKTVRIRQKCEISPNLVTLSAIE